MKKAKGGIPHPTLDKAKNMPGAMPMQNHKFSGKAPMQGGPSKSKHDVAGKGGEMHGMHGAPKAPKGKAKKK